MTLFKFWVRQNDPWHKVTYAFRVTGCTSSWSPLSRRRKGQRRPKTLLWVLNPYAKRAGFAGSNLEIWFQIPEARFHPIELNHNALLLLNYCFFANSHLQQRVCLQNLEKPKSSLQVCTISQFRVRKFGHLSRETIRMDAFQLHKFTWNSREGGAPSSNTSPDYQSAK